MSFFIQSLTDHTKTTENCDNKITGKNPDNWQRYVGSYNRRTLSQSSWLGSHKQDNLTNKEPTYNYAFFAQEYSLLLLDHREYIHFNQKIHFGLYNDILFWQECWLLLLNYQNIFTFTRTNKLCLDKNIHFCFHDQNIHFCLNIFAWRKETSLLL